MNMHFYEINSGLKPYLKFICSMDCEEEADTFHIRVLPDACVELFFNFTNSPIAIIGNKQYTGSIITSRMSVPMEVQMRKGAGCLAICFQPGMAYPFLQVPMHNLTDSTISLSDIWDGLSEIEDQLGMASTNEVRIAILQKYLLQKLNTQKEDMQLNYCLKQLHSSADLIPVSHLSHTLGISQRHLSRKFQEYTGLSTKSYLRVSRFIRSLENMKRKPLLSLTQVAYESGYYDQSHFIRDYKAYAGCTPAEVQNAKRIFY